MTGVGRHQLASFDGMSEAPAVDDEHIAELANVLTAQFASLHLLTRRPIMQMEVGVARVRLLGRLLEHGPLRITELARLLQVRQPGITEMVAGMEQGGLVCRRVHDEDRRGVVVQITPKGERAYHRAHEVRAQAFARYLRDLRPDEVVALEQTVPVYTALIQAMSEEPEPR